MKYIYFLKFFLAFGCLVFLNSVQCARRRCSPEPPDFGGYCKCFEYKPNFNEIECKYLYCHKHFTYLLQDVLEFDFKRLVVKDGIQMKYLPKVIFEMKFTWLWLSQANLVERLFEEVPENNKIDNLWIEQVRIADKEWDWRYISPLKKLITLRMAWIPMEGLNNITHAPKSLKHILIHFCQVKELRDYAFKDFPNLEMVEIREDTIKELKRSMFPSPSRLRIMIFRHNQIATLPADLFEGMNDLTVIDFQHNLLTVLPETTFKPVLTRVLFLPGNPLTCNCEMKWILQAKMIKGNCSTPDNLKGIELKDLEEKNFLHC